MEIVWDQVFQKDPRELVQLDPTVLVRPYTTHLNVGDHTMEAERNTGAGMHISDLLNMWVCAGGRMVVVLVRVLLPPATGDRRVRVHKCSMFQAIYIPYVSLVGEVCM